MPTVATSCGVLKVHSFTPRDRWNSRCVCGLSIAAHDDPPAFWSTGVMEAIREETERARDQVARQITLTQSDEARQYAAELAGIRAYAARSHLIDTLELRSLIGKQVAVPIHAAPSGSSIARTNVGWPSTQSPFGEPWTPFAITQN